MKRTITCCILAALQINLLTACSQNGRRARPVYGSAFAGGSSPTSNSTASAGGDFYSDTPIVSSTDKRGTVDGGGGAGFNGKPLESYKKDVTDFKEFTTYVVPILNSVQRMHPEFAKLFFHIVKNRMWLFMNAPIPEISEKRQGSPYNIDQWAVQNSQELWFSDKYTGSDEDRGRILLHEILVGLKIMRFLSYREYCLVIAPSADLCDGSAEAAAIENYKLDDLDHQDVRAMGDWLWSNHSKMTHLEFATKMHRYQFQSQMHSWKKYLSNDIPAQEVDTNQFIQRLVGTPQKLWSDFGSDKLAKSKCEFEITSVNEKYLNATVRFFKLGATQASRTEQFKMRYFPDQKNTKRADTDRTLVYLSEDVEMKKIGDKQRFLNIHFQGSQLTKVEGGVMVKDSENSASGSWSDPGGAECFEFYVDLPPDFDTLLEMRTRDREFHERRWYDGKTLVEMLRDNSDKYDKP